MSPKTNIPADEIENRISAVQKRMQKSDMEALLVVQRVDLFYFSGTAQNGILFIPADGPPLLLIKRYFPRAKAESPISRIMEIGSVKEVPRRIQDGYGRLPRTLGFELDVLPVRTFRFYERLFPHTGCVDGSPLILQTRMVKSGWEIQEMSKAAELSHKTFLYMRDHIAPGLTEMEFAGQFEAFARKHGHGGKLRVRGFQTEGYPWHVLSGKSGAMPGLLDSPASGEGTSAAYPVGAGYKRLAPHEPIMVDLALVLNGYHTDETRMFAISSMPKPAMDASLAAIEIQDTVLEAVKPGIPVNRLFDLSVQKAAQLGYAGSFLGPPGYKVRFIGHGIGLELIEPPMITPKEETLLRPGMVFSLEPKMVFSDRFTAGIETMFRVTETGYALISQVTMDVFVC
ncbi:MAG: Xaa-Pro peptidase family protein [Deltaproteobacteria bacterium]|nr:Xaa-Pro peptidase family protein [Deltaproteobacteria bacterium]